MILTETEIAKHEYFKFKYKCYCENFEPVNFIWFIFAEDLDMLYYFDGLGIA